MRSSTLTILVLACLLVASVFLFGQQGQLPELTQLKNQISD